jgi:hypothetical protein
MSVIIEIASTEIKTRNGVSQRTGNNYSMREQTGYLHKQGEPYPEKIKITLDENMPPYRIGTYTLAPASFYVDKYDSLAVRPVLLFQAEPSQDQSKSQSATQVPANIKKQE